MAAQRSKKPTGKAQPPDLDDAPAGSLPEPGTEAELTLEELAELSGVAPRTIRFYQGEKLLQRPERDRSDGRVARYGPMHVERLRLIGELRDRGLKLPAIRNLLAEGDASTKVADWLGLDESLRGSWGNDEPRIIQHAELQTVLAEAPPGTQGHLEDGGVLIRQGGAWLLPNPSLFDLTLGLMLDGVPPDLVLAAGAILGRSLQRAANDLIDLFARAVGEGFGRGIDTATLVNAFRPAAGDAARMIFERELERAIRELLNDTKRLGKQQLF